MPSIWKRGTLAAVLAAGMAGLNATAQQPHAPSQCATTPCGPAQFPTPPCGPGPHVTPQWPHSPSMEPPPWPMEGKPHSMPTEPIPTDPSQVPPPPETMPPETMPPESIPDTVPDPIDTTPSPESLTPLDGMPDLSFSMAEAGIGSPDVAFSSAPNMMGDLLRAYRGVTFGYLQAGDFGVANTSGAVNFRNSKVAENNSAIPRDRISFRYNYFKNSLDVRGLDHSPELTPRIQQTEGTPIRQFNRVQPGSQSYSVQLFTFGVEKTFFDDLASVEVRVPFARTLDSSLNLVSGDLLFDVPDRVPLVQPTPQRTLGQYDTEMQDMNVIFKAIIAQDPSRRWLVSSGLGVTIPTGEDLNVRVVDYSNDIEGDPGDFVNPNRDPFGNEFAFDQRTRNFQIKNQTWGVAPFLAGVMTPTNRTFVNGFVQVDVPVNSSRWRFRERDIDLEVQFDPRINVEGRENLPPDVQAVQFDRSLSGNIRDQTLLHLDIGGGYWLYRNPTKRYITGLASLLELHYTTTLEDADIVVVPETPIRTSQGALTQTASGPILKTAPGGLVGPLDPPRLGNIANRMDILNLTMGGHILVGRNIAISTAYVAPLRNEFDRTFDGEFNLQVNWYR